MNELGPSYVWVLTFQLMADLKFCSWVPNAHRQAFNLMVGEPAKISEQGAIMLPISISNKAEEAVGSDVPNDAGDFPRISSGPNDDNCFHPLNGNTLLGLRQGRDCQARSDLGRLIIRNN